MDRYRKIEELIYRSCLLMDDLDFQEYLELCEPSFRYMITAYSPEIKSNMVWLDHNKDGLKELFNTLSKHNSLHSPLTRHVCVNTIEHDKNSKNAKVISTFQVYRTSLDGGITELFAVGKYYDNVSIHNKKPKLLSRDVRLDTRQLDIGSHIPF